MSTPISATLTCAAVALTPGMVTSRSTALRNGLSAASICALELRHRFLPMLDHLQMLAQQESVMGRHSSVQCSAKVACDAANRSLPKAASFAGSLCPAMIAPSIRRPLSPSTSDTTEPSFTIGVFQHLLQALLVLHDLAHQLLARAG